MCYTFGTSLCFYILLLNLEKYNGNCENILNSIKFYI